MNYVCKTCGDQFLSEVWHCPKCNFHWGDWKDQCWVCGYIRNTPNETKNSYDPRNKFYVRRYQTNLKREVMEGLGGCKCAYCGTTEFESLGLDHKNGNHPRHLKGRKLYRAIRDGVVDSDDYTVACNRCNAAKSNHDVDDFDQWILALVQYRFGQIIDIHPIGV